MIGSHTGVSTNVQESNSPLQLRAHLLHHLRHAFDPETLRAEMPKGYSPLPRAYWRKAMANPLDDFMGRGSKMIRANLTEWAWYAAGGEGNLPMGIPMAVEALHAGSLIVDDIEDQATLRRNDLTLHKRYGLASALNAGNWLYFWPQRLIAEIGLTPERELAALKKMGEAQYRCHLGQGLDVSLRVTDIDQTDMPDFAESKTSLKTGSLTELATCFGALAAGADKDTCAVFAEFGGRLGVVLQMLDDAGTIFSDNRGDKAKEDLCMGTATWPWAWAAQHLDGPRYQELIGLSHDVQLGKTDCNFLRQRLRNNLPPDLETMLRERLELALGDLRAVVHEEACIDEIHAQFDRMWRAYV